MRASDKLSKMTKEAFIEAKELLNKAEKIDPDFAAIYTWQVYWSIFWIGQGWGDNPKYKASIAIEIAEKAIEKDPKDALAYAVKAHFLSFIYKQFTYAKNNLRKARKLNPHLGYVWIMSSITATYVGETKKAIEYLDTFAKLGPIESNDPDAKLIPIDEAYKVIYYSARCIAYTLSEQYEKGAYWGKRIVSHRKTFSNGYKPLICCLGHLQKKKEAQKYLEQLKIYEPDFTVSSMMRTYPLKLKTDRDNYSKGLILAGVPE